MTVITAAQWSNCYCLTVWTEAAQSGGKVGTMSNEERNTILIVDDDKHVLMALEGLFESKGYNTTTAWSGHEAVRLLGSQSFEVVLLDDHLPDLDSGEILEHIAGMEMPPQVIVMQAKPPFQAVNRFAALGACDVIGKWMPRREICEAVRNCLAHPALSEACA